MRNSEFDAGSEWTTPDTAVAAPTPAAPAESVEPEVIPDEVVDTAEEPQDELGGTPEVAKDMKPQTSPAVSEFEVKGGKGTKKFKLDPNDPDLVKTLQYGLDYRRMQTERDQAKQAAAAKEKEYSAVAEKAKVWDELSELARLGHREKIAQAVLGEEGFAKLKEEMLTEWAAQESGDPEIAAKYRESRAVKDQQWKEHTYQKQLKQMEEKLAAIEDKSSLENYRTLGTTALQKHDFRGLVEDKDTANALNSKLWKLAWSDIEDMAESQDITPELVNKVFAQNAKILRAGQTSMVNEKVNKVINERKQDTKQKLQVAATQQMSGGQVDLGQWTSGKSKDLLRMLINRGK